MDNTDPPTPSSSARDQVLLDLVYSVKTLAENIDMLHRDLREVLVAEGKERDRELDRIHEIVSKNLQISQVLPVSTADRLDKLINKKVDGVLEDVRLSLNQVHEKLFFYLKTNEARNAIGNGVPSVIDPTEEITGRIEMRKDRIHVHFRTDGIERAWKIVRWIVAAVAAGGGGWAIIKSLLKS